MVLVDLLFSGGTTERLTFKTGENLFSDNTQNIKLKPAEDVIVYWNYENDAELFTVALIADYYKEQNKMLELPYVPNARMDRVKNETDVFSLKTFCNMINAMHFNHVIIMDPHSDVTCALLENVIALDPELYIEGALELIRKEIDDDELVRFYPDAGAMERYQKLKLNIPEGLNLSKECAFGYKNRNWETGEIEGLDIVNKEVLLNKHVLIIDDICSRGDTALWSALKLQKEGVKNIYLYVTHCESTILDNINLFSKLFKGIFTTNSLNTKKVLKGKVTYVGQ